MRTGYDEVLARNSIENLSDQLKWCAEQPCDIEYSYGMPSVVLPFALAVVNDIKVRRPDCVILISPSNEGVHFHVYEPDGKNRWLYIDEDYIEIGPERPLGKPVPLFWRSSDSAIRALASEDP